MARKNKINTTPEKSNRSFNVERLEKEVSHIPNNQQDFKKQSYKPIGNCRYIENYIGIRLNGSDRKNSEFYKMLIVDVEKCFDEPLTVAYVYAVPDRKIETDILTPVGNFRMSKSQRALNIKFNNGKICTISKTTLDKILNNIYSTGIIFERVMEE